MSVIAPLLAFPQFVHFETKIMSVNTRPTRHKCAFSNSREHQKSERAYTQATTAMSRRKKTVLIEDPGIWCPSCQDILRIPSNRRKLAGIALPFHELTEPLLICHHGEVWTIEIHDPRRLLIVYVCKSITCVKIYPCLQLQSYYIYIERERELNIIL